MFLLHYVCVDIWCSRCFFSLCALKLVCTIALYMPYFATMNVAFHFAQLLFVWYEKRNSHLVLQETLGLFRQTIARYVPYLPIICGSHVLASATMHRGHLCTLIEFVFDLFVWQMHECMYVYFLCNEHSGISIYVLVIDTNESSTS